MQTRLLEQFRQTEDGQQAEQILRSCVHCGFCTATCPTYQLLGDELDGPRGRIYQIKQVLEGQQPTTRLQQHLDRCLTCRSCETTCPSGVQYARLLDIGRAYVEQHTSRPWSQQLLRRVLRLLLPYPKRFAPLLAIGRSLQPLLPQSMQNKIPPRADNIAWSNLPQQRRLLVLQGCVQSVATPDTNALASQVFAKLGYELIEAEQAGCCGAVSAHLSATDEARQFMRRNIDAWWPHVEQGVDGILATASGCGLMLHEYGDMLADDALYADKARRIAELVKDPAEILASANLALLNIHGNARRIAFHAPCTLQHGLKQQGVVENILAGLGFELVEVKDSHLCCGSAGTYSILQSELSQQLLHNKVDALLDGQPEVIVTANVGCQLHLQSGSRIPVKHWLSLLV
ncbi:MAG: glycolate oxidase subunit GlcF [Chromatiales bacterium]|jgi:glycolate oxidase iron-sulfur subunit